MQTRTTLTDELTETPQEADAAGDAAFETSGFKAAVFKPMFGQAHQAYFTPRWLCEVLPPIAHHAFGFDGTINLSGTGQAEDRPCLNVLDPTAGSGRLLAPFKQGGAAALHLGSAIGST